MDFSDPWLRFQTHWFLDLLGFPLMLKKYFFHVVPFRKA
jgi:hypothetical protein